MHKFGYRNSIAALTGTLLVGALLGATPSVADGIVAKVVNSPLNSAGLVRDGYSALNVYLQKPEAMGIEFFNPEIPGFGIPAGGALKSRWAEVSPAIPRFR